MKDFLKKQVSMTSVLLLGSMILIGQGICAQIANDGDWEVTPEDNMFAIPDGNVGIGMTEPGEKLHISAGNIRIERVDSGSHQGLVIIQGNTDKPPCNAENQGAITYEESCGISCGHFWGCRGTGGGNYTWVQLNN